MRQYINTFIYMKEKKDVSLRGARENSTYIHLFWHGIWSSLLFKLEM